MLLKDFNSLKLFTDNVHHYEKKKHIKINFYESINLRYTNIHFYKCRYVLNKYG